jgi:hypothetical protein
MSVAKREQFIPVFQQFSAAKTRESIVRLQECIKDMPQINPPVNHHFAPYMYAREIFMKAGDLVVGKIHNHSHVNNISKGRVLVTTEFGSEELVAPYQFVSKAGTKRAVMVLEDCIWTTYHPQKKRDVSEKDLADIEADVIAKDYDEFEYKKLGFFGKVKKLLKVNV